MMSREFHSVPELMGLSPVIPVATLNDPTSAVEIARALSEGGVRVLEVTLRTPKALACLAAVATALPDVVVGAGTVVTPDQVDAAVEAGARFLVSPGYTPQLLDHIQRIGMAALPGIATMGEAMKLMERGLTAAKFFPAAAAGGVPFVQAMAGPFPDFLLCPTGGITVDTALDYLRCPNVPCVGGSWLIPEGALRDHDWASIRRLAAIASNWASPEAQPK